MRHLLHRAGACALSAVLLLPVALVAQDDDMRSPQQLVIDVEKSDRLFDEAIRLEANRDSWMEAAKTYVQSARLRPYGDAQAFVATFRAGILFSHLDKVNRARRAFATAGVRGLETGNVHGAARAFANAAELGRHERDPGAGQRNLNYWRIAHRLSESPLLTESQRQEIHERLSIAAIGGN